MTAPGSLRRVPAYLAAVTRAVSIHAGPVARATATS